MRWSVPHSSFETLVNAAVVLSCMRPKGWRASMSTRQEGVVVCHCLKQARPMNEETDTPIHGRHPLKTFAPAEHVRTPEGAEQRTGRFYGKSSTTTPATKTLTTTSTTTKTTTATKTLTTTTTTTTTTFACCVHSQQTPSCRNKTVDAYTHGHASNHSSSVVFFYPPGSNRHLLLTPSTCCRRI